MVFYALRLKFTHLYAAQQSGMNSPAVQELAGTGQPTLENQLIQETQSQMKSPAATRRSGEAARQVTGWGQVVDPPAGFQRPGQTSLAGVKRTRTAGHTAAT